MCADSSSQTKGLACLVSEHARHTQILGNFKFTPEATELFVSELSKAEAK
jgi:hypothetical protein